MNFENELRAALRREEAPPDFAAKVLARVSTKAAVIPFWRRPAALALAAGLAIAAITPTAVHEYHRRERERALEARRQLITALTITRVKLQETREMIRRTTRRTL